MKWTIEKLYKSIFFSFIVACLISNPAVSAMAGEKQEPTIEQLAAGEGGGWLPPSIEELTQGKVKIGDQITKDNVDLVKEYLPLTVYEMVRTGMVLVMANNIPPEKLVPRYLWEATVRNKGKAIMDENGTVRLKDGSVWPGGLPFPVPKTALEAMADVKFGIVMDDYNLTYVPIWYVDKDGKIYKTAANCVSQIMTTARFKVPPLGVIPGHDNEQWRNITSLLDPQEIRGLGQLTIRRYDEYKEPDQGFAYIPAFKRVIRISATTYQDNVAGTDQTFGDPHALREPYAYWNFTSMERKLMLFNTSKAPVPWMTADGKVNEQALFDCGHKFPRTEWAITPVLVIEAVSKIKHVYGKKVLYLYDPPYWTSMYSTTLADIYDNQGKLWKCYNSFRDARTGGDGIEYQNVLGISYTRDLQTDHTTVAPTPTTVNFGRQIDFFSLTQLLKQGR